MEIQIAARSDISTEWFSSYQDLAEHMLEQSDQRMIVLKALGRVLRARPVYVAGFELLEVYDNSKSRVWPLHSMYVAQEGCLYAEVQADGKVDICPVIGEYDDDLIRKGAVIVRASQDPSYDPRIIFQTIPIGDRPLEPTAIADRLEAAISGATTLIDHALSSAVTLPFADYSDRSKQLFHSYH